VAADGAITADPEHPANRGRLCSKGAALGETLSAAGRLLYPAIDGRRTTWDEALEHIAAVFSHTIAANGPDAVAFYVSGQFLTEDYYVANKLMKGFIGSGNIDSNSRLCMASAVSGHVRAFGEDVVPGCYEDLEAADLAILVGSNTAWCHPVLYQRLADAKTVRGTKIVVVDPRRTATCDIADLHLQLRPGSDVALFAGLLLHLDGSGASNADWISEFTSGFEAAIAAAKACVPSLAATAELTDLPAGDVALFFDWFARHERTVTLYSQGVNQSSAGTDKVNAIINCHLATGRIGRAGTGPFSLTGQPNAMGGREVGGLANQLAAHMTFEDPANLDRVRRFWRAPRLAGRPGFKAVDLFDAVLDGSVRALWILGTNPAASMPRAERVRAALAACPFVVVSDCWPTDTTRFAEIVLPAAAWGEKDGTVTNSERCISRQRGFRKPPGEAQSDWWMMAEVARRMGWRSEFAYNSPADIFREHAALSGFENDGPAGRIFDIRGLARLSDGEYRRLEPIRWPVPSLPRAPSDQVGPPHPAPGKARPRLANPSQPSPPTGEREEGEEGSSYQSHPTRDCHGEPECGRKRMFGEGTGFPTADGRAHFVPTMYRPPAADRQAPLVLNTGRVRDQWHTMTRTGRVPRLMARHGEPLIDIHPADAAGHGLADGDLARVESSSAATVLRVRLSADQRRGEAFAPMHWTDQFTAAGPIGRVVAGVTDPISGQPELKTTRVRLTPVAAHWYGLLLRQSERLPMGDCYWTRVPLTNGQAFELAGWSPLISGAGSEAWVAGLLDASPMAELVIYADPGRDTYRYASLIGGRLEGVLFLAREATSLPRRDRLAALLGTVIDLEPRASLLAGQSAVSGAVSDPGRTVCSCFAIGLHTLHRTIADHRLTTVAEIGNLLRAGTNCGSCIPEIRSILRDAGVRTVAA
jgi:assimilatory nitrate reductase catalytic subunit